MIQRAARISKRKQNALMKCFVLDLGAQNASEIVGISRNTANLYYRHWRELIYQATRFAPRFFGEVEMDQAEFGGRGRKRMQALLKRYEKVMTHKEYMEKARAIRKEHKVLVLGILQRGGAVYAHIIKRMDARTLIPIVRLVVEDTATVYTDKWRGFDDLGLDGYTHRSVNHSEEYVAKDGSHINGIESFWSFTKRRLSKFNGIARTTLPLHIKESEFRYNHPDMAAAMKTLTSGAPSSRQRSQPVVRSPRGRR